MNTKSYNFLGLNLFEKILLSSFAITGLVSWAATDYYHKPRDMMIIDPTEHLLRQSHSLEEQERDLNGNNIPERFIEYHGIKYFHSIDGKNLEDSFREAESFK